MQIYDGATVYYSFRHYAQLCTILSQQRMRDRSVDALNVLDRVNAQCPPSPNSECASSTVSDDHDDGDDDDDHHDHHCHYQHRCHHHHLDHHHPHHQQSHYM
mmetsp:Transcript_20655/g.39979  ORF Transcript_20655/g.39979 Transcript_20655/m.39979 type:complete len:102 (-) Transcript_20655:344-649(-)